MNTSPCHSALTDVFRNLSLDVRRPGTASNTHNLRAKGHFTVGQVSHARTNHGLFLGLQASLPAHAQPRPWPSPITPWTLFQHEELGPEQRGENTNEFPNNTFLSTTQNQQGQNKWQHHQFVELRALEFLAESRAASRKGSPCPQPRTNWALQCRDNADTTRWECIFLFMLIQWHPTPVLMPGESHGWRSLVGCSPWGR